MKKLFRSIFILFVLAVSARSEALADIAARAEAEPAADAEAQQRFEKAYSDFLQLVSGGASEAECRSAWKTLCGNWKIETGDSPNVLFWNSIKARAESGALKNLTAMADTAATLQMIWLPAGSFQMGSARGAEDEQPVHRVTLSHPFWMAQTEVTVALWKCFLEETRYTLGTDFFDDECPLKRDGKSFNLNNNPYAAAWDLPMVEINWNACTEFCRWLTEHEREAGRLPEGYVYSLPTEAQWEYACRALLGGTDEGTDFSFGNDERRLNDFAWYEENSDGVTHPVKEKKPNAWGLYGMHGNVWEWCLDDREDEFYATAPERDPVNLADSSYRAIRGGGWLTDAEYCRSANRGRVLITSADSNLGFRICLTRTANAEVRPETVFEKKDSDE